VGLTALPLLVPLVLPAPVVAAALAVCGLAFRGRYRPIGLYFLLIPSLLAGGIAVSALLYELCHVALPGCAGYAPFLALGVFLALVAFVVLLPFLLLSAVSPFCRERLKALLHVKPAVAAARAPATVNTAIYVKHVILWQ
jgi:hypothetical protein